MPGFTGSLLFPVQRNKSILSGELSRDAVQSIGPQCNSLSNKHQTCGASQNPLLTLGEGHLQLSYKTAEFLYPSFWLRRSKLTVFSERNRNQRPTPGLGCRRSVREGTIYDVLPSHLSENTNASLIILAEHC